MRYKEKVISNLDGISNQLSSIKNIIDNNNITKELLLSELGKLITRIDDVSNMVSLEDTDFTTLKNGIQG